MKSVIQFQNVSKKFTLKHQKAKSFQEIFVNLFRFKQKKTVPSESIQVLNNVSFKIDKGEAVAFIGPNGTGKSTTLKLISGILLPDEGTVVINGRIGALLELGAGFHPDLTGRENIYLNAAVLGLSKQQIDARLSEIIDFSELNHFIDVPVKHYSSGMFMRLGFSIAVHTDPDILLVDEVLAVGDASFQRKCLEKILELKRQGVTIILVSHHMADVRRVCERAIWMEKGKIVEDGASENVIRNYLEYSLRQDPSDAVEISGQRSGTGIIRIEQVYFRNGEGKIQTNFHTGDELTIEMRYTAQQPYQEPVFGIGIHRNDGVHVTGPNTGWSGFEIPMIKGSGVVRYIIPHLPLLQGTYYISLSVSDKLITEMFDYHDQMYPIKILPSPAERYGMVTMGGHWEWDEE